MKDRIKIAIQEWKEQDLPSIIPRNTDIKKLLKDDFIRDIVGIRRSGKTYIMYSIVKEIGKSEKTIYINFENRKLWPLEDELFDELMNHIYENELLKKYKKIYLFLDEIQRMKNWERFVRNIHDDLKDKIKVFVSGSSSKIGSKETRTLLTGRHLSLNLFPLDFREFLGFKNFDLEGVEYSQQKISIIRKLLLEYLEFGGFPKVVLSENKVEILSQYYLDILYRDIIERYEIRDVKNIEDMALYLMTNISSLFSCQKTANFFKGSLKRSISTATVQNYLKYFEEVFLIFTVPIFSFKIKEQMQYPRKIYCIDSGLSTTSGFRFMKDINKLFENTVAVELFRRSFKEPAMKIFYWHGQQQREVDFVVKKGLKVKELIQVCCDISKSETKEREIKSLLAAMDEFKLTNGLVITDDFEAEEKINGKVVKYIPLWKWLLALA